MTLLAPKDAAARLGISVSRLVQLDRERILVALRDSGNRRIYSSDAVERFAAERHARQRDGADDAQRAIGE